MPSEPTTVTLGGEAYVLVPQKHTRVKAGITRLFQSLGESDITTGGGLMGVVEAKAHEALSIFIPTVMSEEDFLGTGPLGDAKVPTIPEIRDALSKGMSVNGIPKDFGVLKEFIPTELLKALVHQQVAEAVAQSARRSLPSSPSPSGASDLTTTTPSSPTSSPTDDLDSPTLGYETSSPSAMPGEGESSAN